MQFAYMFELAAYTFHGFEHRFLQVKQRDYFVMIAHHVTPCALVIGSCVSDSYRIRVVVMFIRDSSDIIVDIAQFLNHAHMEAPLFGFVFEGFFPFKVIKSLLFDHTPDCRPLMRRGASTAAQHEKDTPKPTANTGNRQQFHSEIESLHASDFHLGTRVSCPN
jgi:hypothetical protein